MLPVALITAMPTALRLKAQRVIRGRPEDRHGGVGAGRGQADAQQLDGRVAGIGRESQPAAENSIGSTRCHLRSCLRSERRPHQIMPMIVQTCGMAASRPIVMLLASALKLLTISGVQTATMARVLTRQK